MSYRPKIKSNSSGSLTDLALDAETVASKGVHTTFNATDNDNFSTDKAIATYISNQGFGKGIVELADQYIRITSLNEGIYKLTYAGTKYIYYNGSTSTSTTTVAGGSGAVILTVNKYNSTTWHWYYINGTTGYETIYYGYTTTSSGLTSSKYLNNLLTSHQSIKTLNTDIIGAQSVSSNESISGSGTIKLHRVSKTGNYNDLLNKPNIPGPSELIQRIYGDELICVYTRDGNNHYYIDNGGLIISMGKEGDIGFPTPDTPNEIATKLSAAGTRTINLYGVEETDNYFISDDEEAFDGMNGYSGMYKLRYGFYKNGKLIAVCEIPVLKEEDEGSILYNKIIEGQIMFMRSPGGPYGCWKAYFDHQFWDPYFEGGSAPINEEYQFSIPLPTTLTNYHPHNNTAESYQIASWSTSSATSWFDSIYLLEVMRYGNSYVGGE